jgi:hypothetical protein
VALLSHSNLYPSEKISQQSAMDILGKVPSSFGVQGGGGEGCKGEGGLMPQNIPPRGMQCFTRSIQHCYSYSSQLNDSELQLVFYTTVPSNL